jgi:sigma-B regulation protein RsbU (phosphoserine phosphatase)
VFFVAEALGSPYVPAQEDFVIPSGIRSVLGFGGVLPSGELFAVILFSQTPIAAATAERFGSIALSVKLALLAFVDGPVFDRADDSALVEAPPVNEMRNLQSRVTALEQLLGVREASVLSQALHLESALAEAEERAEELSVSRRALAESEARKGAVVTSALDGVVTIDDSGRILEFNPAAQQIFGYTHDEVLGRPMAELIIPASLRSRHNRGFADYLENGRGPILGKRIELTGMRREGDEFPIELAVVAVEGAAGRLFTGYIRDITAQKAAASALADSRRRTAHIARTLQDSLLPPVVGAIPGVEVATRYRPAGDGSEVGGDFYDVFETSKDDWSIALGDVCGKGTEAAVVTALARYTMRATAIRSRRPSAVLSILNQAVIVQHPERFLTVIYARLRRRQDRVRVTVGSGGHPLALVVRPDGSIVEVGGRGLLIGQFEEAKYTDENFDLALGDCIVFYTDGVTEARRDDDFFGEDRLRAVLTGAAGSGARAMAQAIEDAVLAFQGELANDDIALLALSRYA